MIERCGNNLHRAANGLDENRRTSGMTARLQTLMFMAESGDAEAMTELALVHARGEERQHVDLAKAVAWYWKAADAGSCRAMGNLAYLYLNAISVRKDPARAVALYEEAVKGPSPDLEQYLYDLANCYELGIGVPLDRVKAMSLYSKSAQLGSRLAQQALSRLKAMAVAA